MTIALYGGKFDPPHLGHKNLIKQVLNQLPSIDQVWIIPAKTHPWRQIFASENDRMEMLKTWENYQIKILDIEIKSDKPTVTINTIRKLKEIYPSHNFYWICGSDTLPTFHLWDEHEELIKLIKFYVYPRVGYPIKKLPQGFHRIPGFKLPKSNFSSTKIRSLVHQNKSTKNYLSKKIREYIDIHNLYRKEG